MLRLKKLRYGIILFLCLFCLAGCGETSDNPSVTAKITPTDTPLPEPQMETITIFTIDPSTMSLKPSQVKKQEDDNSPGLITDLVLSNLNDDGIVVTATDLSGDTVTITFSSEGKPIRNCEEDMEYLILDCFANSILDNVDGCHKVIFRSDKGAYVSEHITMKEDEVYASK